LNAKVLAEPALVGREGELEELHRLLNLSLEGKGNTVFVSGEAGSGKTRLTHEFLNTAREKGVGVLAGWCLSDAATPYFPFVEAFNSYFANQEEEQIASFQRLGEPQGFAGSTQVVSLDRGITTWLAGPKPVERAGVPETLSPQVWKDQVFASVAKTLHVIASQQPIILFIEDIHWADSASLALLHYITRSVNNSERILVLATFRSEDLTADAEGRSHPLVETLRLMKREELFREIKLSSLREDCVSFIAQSMLGGTLDSEIIDRLTKESRGNALFVVESLRMWSERGSLIQERNGLRLAMDELGVPTKFRDIILRRIASLKFGQRRVLDVASAIGEKFDPQLLGFVLGKDSLEVLETLDEVAQSTCMVCAEGDFYRFDHARSREILYQEISSPLKKGYHAKIARGLESKIKTLEKVSLGSLAYHYAQAGNKEKAVEYALEAGEDALARFSNTEATNSFKYVLSATEEMSGYSDQRIKALFGLGDALQFSGVSEEALKIFESLIDLADSGAVKLRALRRAFEVSLWLRRNSVRMLELATAAERYSQCDKMEFARIRVAKADAISRRGDIEEALKESEEALSVFEEENSLSDIAQTLQLMTIYYARKDKTPVENAIALAVRSTALFKEVGDMRSLLGGISHLAIMFTSCGLFDKALEYYTTCIEIDEKRGNWGGVAVLCFWLGVLFETHGILQAQSGNLSEFIEDFKIAVSHNLKGAQAAEKTDAAVGRRLNYGNLIRQYVALREMEKAENFFKKLEKTFETTADVQDPWLLAQCLRSKAVFLAARGQRLEANRLFEESIFSFEKYTGLAFPMFIAETRIAYAEALAQQQKIEESKTQLEKANVITEEYTRCKEKLDHANIQTSFMTKRKVEVGEEFRMRIDIVNASINPTVVVRLENIEPQDFKIDHLPSNTRLQKGVVEMNEKKVDPFQVESIRLTLHAEKTGNFTLNPQVSYIDEQGETKTCKPNPITIIVQPAKPKYEILPGRISTGSEEINALLFGGIPEKYAVILTSPSNDEREQLISRFLEAGATAGETTFYITAEAVTSKALAEKYTSNYCLFVCNPQADAIVQDQPNVFKLKGIENLTEIDISLTKAFRKPNPSEKSPKRICIEIVSDVLLQHHAINTRRWLSSLLPTLKSKGFTILAVVDPQMHTPEETQAILGLFDGEISLYEKESEKGLERFLRIKRLSNQKFSKNETKL
jgi:tetratricopeptide (TPR) repeat protein/KaiC/GvpD/RAD55 family RecA-like ATPase